MSYESGLTQKCLVTWVSTHLTQLTPEAIMGYTDEGLKPVPDEKGIATSFFACTQPKASRLRLKPVPDEKGIATANSRTHLRIVVFWSETCP